MINLITKKYIFLCIAAFAFFLPNLVSAEVFSYPFGPYYCIRHGDHKDCDEQVSYLPGVGYTNITVTYRLEGHRHDTYSWINTNVCLNNICQWNSYVGNSSGPVEGDGYPL
jgi:hypothetical protein